MPVTQEQMARFEEAERERKEDELELVRFVIGMVKFWQHCEHRICRRMRSCVKTETCQTRYADDIRWWKREQLLPYLRKRYPSVQWGAPAGITELQVEAALAAEAEREAREAARKAGKPLPRKRRRKRVPRHPLYVPRDFAGGQEPSRENPAAACPGRSAARSEAE